MKKYLPFLIVTLMCISADKAAAQAPSPEGLWLTENKRSAIKIEKCDSGLCGKVAWIIEDGMQYDTANPDESLRGRPMCGLQIMSGLQQNEYDPAEWEDGEIYKADDGDIYSAELEVLNENEIEVTGYVGFSFIGKTQTWTRVNAKDYPPCRPPEK
jgi:uncharacterized protein (DUF2147 family)